MKANLNGISKTVTRRRKFFLPYWPYLVCFQNSRRPSTSTAYRRNTVDQNEDFPVFASASNSHRFNALFVAVAIGRSNFIGFNFVAITHFDLKLSIFQGCYKTTTTRLSYSKRKSCFVSRVGHRFKGKLRQQKRKQHFSCRYLGL